MSALLVAFVLVCGLGLAAMNLDAAREVWEAAHEEHAAAQP